MSDYYVSSLPQSDPQNNGGSFYQYEDNAENELISDEGTSRRRNSMPITEDQQRRASIQAILKDTSMTSIDRRKSIQYLMDGRRNSLGMMGAQINSPGVANHNKCSPMATPDSSSSWLLQNNTSDGLILCQPTDQAKRAELSRPKCDHYNRNCSIVSPCCGATFGCRFCHDDSPVLPPLSNQSEQSQRTETKPNTGRRKYQRSCSMPTSFASFAEPQHHTVDRFSIKEVICRKCYTRQSSKTNECVNCHVKFGEYHCDRCNLWMDNDERPYHCADCGFCRVGGADNFRHCQDCGMCIDALLFDQHSCKVGKYMSNCPVCQEDLFSSRKASHEMPCGHAIHWHCFKKLAEHDSRCPICKKTAGTHESMLPTWQAVAMGIELRPVPPDIAKVVTIICNDCEMGDVDRGWHFLGVQCLRCQSFNTVTERITMVGPEAHAFLLRRKTNDNTNLSKEIESARDTPSRRRSYHNIN
mmetsp:Transcript_30386/g.29287  ORF Transcript_30386/g.29287 Transcript_30386/m.29287 type:complete len:470 (-) Transcript_30386:107-1516(-)